MREMFANKEFRKALSLGINRKEIIDIVYLGQSRAATRPARARAIPGTTRSSRGSSPSTTPGRRTPSSTGSATRRTRRASACGRTGRRCSSPIDVIPTLYPDQVDTLELVKRHWAEIGIDMKVNTHRARALLHARRQQRP